MEGEGAERAQEPEPQTSVVRVYPLEMTGQRHPGYLSNMAAEMRTAAADLLRWKGEISWN